LLGKIVGEMGVETFLGKNLRGESSVGWTRENEKGGFWKDNCC